MFEKIWKQLFFFLKFHEKYLILKSKSDISHETLERTIYELELVELLKLFFWLFMTLFAVSINQNNEIQ